MQENLDSLVNGARATLEMPPDGQFDSLSAASKETLLIASKVREIIRSYQCNTAGDALDGLNTWVHLLIEQATKRAQANGRKTIRAHDFMA